MGESFICSAGHTHATKEEVLACNDEPESVHYLEIGSGFWPIEDARAAARVQAGMSACGRTGVIVTTSTLRTTCRKCRNSKSWKEAEAETL